jgi:hypothetical protein
LQKAFDCLTVTCITCACTRLHAHYLQVPLEDDQIFLHIGELSYVAARQQGKSAAQAYYLPSKVGVPCASCGVA